MSRPSAVQKQAEASAELAKKTVEQMAAESGGAPDLDAMLDELTGEQQTADQGNNAEEERNNSAPPKPETQPPPESTKPPPDEEKGEKYRALDERYRVLKGKYDAEVPRLNQQLRDVQNELKTLRGENAELKRTAALAGNTEKVNRIKAELGDEYSPEMVDKLTGLIEAMVAGAVPAPSAEPPDNLNQAHDAHDAALKAELTAHCPRWRKVEQPGTELNRRWLIWLDKAEGDTGFKRDDLLQQHARSGNMYKVSRFYERFLAEIEQAEVKLPDQTPEPDPSPSAPPSTNNTPRIYKATELRKVEAEINRRQRARRDYSELVPLRDRIYRAISEGNFDPTK